MEEFNERFGFLKSIIESQGDTKTNWGNEMEDWIRSSLQSILLEAERRMPTMEQIPELEGADGDDCRIYNDIVEDCKQVLRNMREGV